MAHIAATSEAHRVNDLKLTERVLGWLRDVLESLTAPAEVDDPISRFSPQERADLPTYHPERDE